MKFLQAAFSISPLDLSVVCGLPPLKDAIKEDTAGQIEVSEGQIGGLGKILTINLS